MFPTHFTLCRVLFILFQKILIVIKKWESIYHYLHDRWTFLLFWKVDICINFRFTILKKKNVFYNPSAFYRLISFIAIWLLYSFKYDFSVVYLVCKVRLYQKSEFQIVDGTAFHSLKILFLVDFTPISHFAKILLQDHIKPDSCTSAVAFHEWMSNVHFDVFWNYFFKCSFGHFFYCSNSFFQI